MAKPIVIMPKAAIQLEHITDYLDAEFGEQVRQRFILRFKEVTNIISGSPEIYSIANEKRRIRKRVLNKQCNVYFRVYARKIEILAVFDTRQRPGRLKDV